MKEITPPKLMPLAHTGRVVSVEVLAQLAVVGMPTRFSLAGVQSGAGALNVAAADDPGQHQGQ